MNVGYPIPGSNVDQTTFIANSSFELGSYTKAVADGTVLHIDYSKLVPAQTITDFSFRVSPGGSPQLNIASAVIATNILTIVMSGGRAGVAYRIEIIGIGATGTRTDFLDVQLLDDGGCGCEDIATAPLTPVGNVSGDGGMYINTALRYFVSSTVPVDGRIFDRWYNTTTGDIYDFVTDGLKSWWELSTLGGGGGYGANVVKMNSLTPDGNTKVFTLTATDGTTVDIIGTNTLLVSVDGVWQEPTTMYSAVDNQLTFIEAPLVGAVIFMIWFSPPPATP